MKKKDLASLQLNRLKAILTYAYEKVPHYHKSFEERGFRPYDIKSLEDIRKVPVLDKSTLRGSLGTLLARDSTRKKLKPLFTSGTTAFPVRFYRSNTDLSWGLGAELRAYGWGGYKVGDKVALIWSFESEQTRKFEFQLYNLLMRHRILNLKHQSENAMTAFARGLVRFRPDFVRGYSASTNIFATFLLQNPQFRIRPKTVFTSASTLLPHYRNRIEKAFDCQIHDFYGSREISSIAGQCGQHEALHVSDENVLLEIVKDNEPVSFGEDGKILLTNLHSYVMPLIRYDIGDVGQMFPDECSCGRHLSLMKPYGRTYEFFVGSDGSFTNLHDIQQVFAGLPVIDFQIIQKDYDEIVIKIVPGPKYTCEHSSFIERHIRERGNARIRVELADSIPPEESGKTRHVVLKLPSKYT